MLRYVIYLIVWCARTILSNIPPISPQKSETMQRSDVYMFPIIGSCVLFGLYIVMKIVPRVIFMFFVKIYFVIMGVYVVAKRVSQILILTLPSGNLSQLQSVKHQIPLVVANEKLRPVVAGYNKLAVIVEAKLSPIVAQVQPYIDKALAFVGEKPAESKPAEAAPAAPASAGHKDDLFPASVTLDGVDMAAYGFAALSAVIYLIWNHWLSNNIFGICFSIQAIELLNLGSYMNGVFLLSGLFFYDIFWVFGTDVMITVAKNFDGPIKLLFPMAERPAMLGLGDIVIPGFFIALMLKLDIALNRPLAVIDANAARKPAARGTAESPLVTQIKTGLLHLGNYSAIGIRTEYFNTVLVSYVMGLLVTVGVMYVFKSGQPALLYLVPACLGSTAGVAYMYGKAEFDKVVQYADDESTVESETPAPVSADAAPAAAAPAAVAPAPVSAVEVDAVKED